MRTLALVLVFAGSAAALTVEEVVQLSEAGVSDEIIVDQMEADRSSFRLSAADIIDLQKRNVSPVVIRFMVTSRGKQEPPAEPAAGADRPMREPAAPSEGEQDAGLTLRNLSKRVLSVLVYARDREIVLVDGEIEGATVLFNGSSAELRLASALYGVRWANEEAFRELAVAKDVSTELEFRDDVGLARGVRAVAIIDGKEEADHPRHGANFRVFDPLEFIAEVVAHIPDTYEKTAIEYGWYSNRTRGWRKKRGMLPADPPAKDPAADSDKGSLDQRRAWARLIQKVYEVNPLLCPRCGTEMKVVAVIADEDTIYRILKHLGLLAAPEESRAPPAAAPAPSPASPPAQASLPLPDAPASPLTALLDSIPRDLFSDDPAWDAPEPPAPDPAAPDLPGAGADPGPGPEDFGDGDPPDDEDIA